MDPLRRAATRTGRWLRENLFSSWYNALLTVVAAWLVVTAVRRAGRYVLTAARWDVIPANLALFAAGTYPAQHRWRLWLVALLLAAWAALSSWLWSRARPDGSRRLRGAVVAGWLLAVPLAALILRGKEGNPWLAPVPTQLWGGLMLTLVLAVTGVAASFPLGVVLALGRRSRLPAVRWVCTAYIEVMRGVPLVSVLFMVQVMVPVFLPSLEVDKMIRAWAGFTAFTAAYMAENLRGGLQSVPRGQYEAAAALGLPDLRTLRLIVLPQALRAVIPAIVGQSITLLKDTSLVAVIGLLDLLGIARSVLANPQWLGLQAEVYLFLAAVYWLCTYAMALAGRRLERRWGLGVR